MLVRWNQLIKTYFVCFRWTNHTNPIKSFVCSVLSRWLCKGETSWPSRALVMSTNPCAFFNESVSFPPHWLRSPGALQALISLDHGYRWPSATNQPLGHLPRSREYWIQPLLVGNPSRVWRLPGARLANISLFDNESIIVEIWVELTSRIHQAYIHFEVWFLMQNLKRNWRVFFP